MFFYIVIASLFTLFASEMYIISYAKESQIESPDFILLLGSGTQVDTPLLKERIQKAQAAQIQFPQTPVLISGTPQEIKAMKSFFQNPHLHDKATRTYDSMYYVATIKPEAKVLIATNAFHMIRSLALANAFKLNAQGLQEPQFYITSAVHSLREVLGRLRCSWDILTLHKK